MRELKKWIDCKRLMRGVCMRGDGWVDEQTRWKRDEWVRGDVEK